MAKSYEENIKNTKIEGVLGQEAVKDELKSAILMKRHVILVGQPGIGKTTLVRSLVNLLPNVEGEEKTPPFVRVQGSPDLTAEDLIGDIDPSKAIKYGPLSPNAFTPGKIFKADKGILFFDEINRCSEKLQNTLLQVLEERKATIGSYEVDFDANFILIGTMNPEEASTEPLSDVFLDRFDMIYMYPPESLEIEMDILKSKNINLVKFPDGLLKNTIKFVRKLRGSEDLEKHPSVRATLGIYERAQSNAYLSSRKEVNVEDIQRAVVGVLSHRIRLKPSLKYVKTTTEFLKEEFVQQFSEDLAESGDAP